MNIVLDTGSLDTLHKALTQFPKLAKQEIRATMHAVTGLLTGEVVDRTPVRTSHLRGSIHPFVQDIPGGMLGIVGTSVNYAIPVELGTKPHDIRPRNGKALAFMFRGAKVVLGGVHHPGTTGSFMFTNALRDNKAEIERQFASMVQRLTDRLAGAAK